MDYEDLAQHVAAAMGASGRLRGTVKQFGANGFGFISQEDGPDVFVHYTDIRGKGYRELRAGDQVEFIPESREGERHKLRARDVVLLTTCVREVLRAISSYTLNGVAVDLAALAHKHRAARVICDVRKALARGTGKFMIEFEVAHMPDDGKECDGKA